MKHILNYGLMAAMVTAVTFSSCTKDNEEDEIELSILPKKITRIEGSNYFSGNQFSYEFDSDGKIIKTTKAFYSETYQYTDNSVIWSGEILGINVSTTAKWESKNGRITSIKYTSFSDDGVDVDEEYGQMKYSYSANGYLSTMEGTMGGSKIKATYCVENGIVKSISSDTEGDETIISMTNFAYSSKILNNLNVNIWNILYDAEPIFGDKLGKRFVQLPTSCTFVGKNGEEEESMSYTFLYEYDGDYLKKITSIQNYDGKTEATTYEIFYEQ